MITLAATLLLAAIAPQEDTTQRGPRVVLEALDGTRRTVNTAAEPITSLAGKGAAFVRFVEVDRPEVADERSGAALQNRATLELAGGDRLAGSVSGGDGDQLHVELTGGVRVELSIDGIRSVVYPSRIPDSVTSAPTAGDDGDRLYLLAPGGSLDRAEGFVEAFGKDGITFEDARVGGRTFGWDRVAALFITPFEDEGEDPGVAEGAASAERISVSLVGGGRLSGTLVRIGSIEEGVTLGIGGGAEVQLPGSIVTEVALDDGSFRFLGDVAPSDRGASSPFGDDLGFTWPMRVDRNCRGGLLRVGGVEFARGLGVHAPSRVTWNLKAGWKELRFGCGMDETAANGTRSGSARFRVVGDGKVLWESEVLRAGGAAVLPKPVDLSGVQSLVLEVDPAGDFVLDRANWLRPMLVR